MRESNSFVPYTHVITTYSNGGDYIIGICYSHNFNTKFSKSIFQSLLLRS